MHKMEKQRNDWLYLFWVVEHYLYFFKIHANKNSIRMIFGARNLNL